MLYNLTDPFTDAERAKVRERIEAFYDTFVTKAAEGRGMTWDEVDAVAGGRVWTGEQAYEVGLVDELGSLEDAVDVAMEEAGVIKPEDVGRAVLPRRQTPMEALLKSLNEQQVQATQERVQEQALRDLVGEEVADALERGQAMQRVLEVGGIAAMDPVHVRVH